MSVNEEVLMSMSLLSTPSRNFRVSMEMVHEPNKEPSLSPANHPVEKTQASRRLRGQEALLPAVTTSHLPKLTGMVIGVK